MAPGPGGRRAQRQQQQQVGAEEAERAQLERDEAAELEEVLSDFERSAGLQRSRVVRIERVQVRAGRCS